MGALSYARLPARPLFGVARFHAIAPPRVSSRPTASQSVPYRELPPAVPHQAKRRKRPVFSLFFAVLAMAPPARIELATLALGKPCSIQLSYGGGRRGGCHVPGRCSSLSKFSRHFSNFTPPAGEHVTSCPTSRRARLSVGARRPALAREARPPF